MEGATCGVYGGERITSFLSVIDGVQSGRELPSPLPLGAEAIARRQSFGRGASEHDTGREAVAGRIPSQAALWSSAT